MCEFVLHLYRRSSHEEPWVFQTTLLAQKFLVQYCAFSRDGRSLVVHAAALYGTVLLVFDLETHALLSTVPGLGSFRSAFALCEDVCLVPASDRMSFCNAVQVVSLQQKEVTATWSPTWLSGQDECITHAASDDMGIVQCASPWSDPAVCYLRLHVPPRLAAMASMSTFRLAWMAAVLC